MEIKTKKELYNETLKKLRKYEDGHGYLSASLNIERDEKWMKIDEEFVEMMRLLKSFLTNGYGEHKDFRNMGTDYERRCEVFKYFLDLNGKVQQK